jgi:hypothetical protein
MYNKELPQRQPSTRRCGDNLKVDRASQCCITCIPPCNSHRLSVAFHISVFRNTLDANTADTTADLLIPRTMDAKTVRELVIAKMGLPLDYPSLSYNISKERLRQYHELSSEDDMKAALGMMADFNDRADKIQPIMTIKNLVRKLSPPCNLAKLMHLPFALSNITPL